MLIMGACTRHAEEFRNTPSIPLLNAMINTY